MFGRRRFGELIDMQLRVFEQDHAHRLEALRDALEAYRRFRARTNETMAAAAVEGGIDGRIATAEIGRAHV